MRFFCLFLGILSVSASSAVHRELERLNLVIKNKPFTRRHGFPEYQSYCMLAHVLLNADNIHTWLEFGVAGGVSINVTAHILPRAQIIGFDSFEGLPHSWSGHFRAGAFSQNGMLPVVKHNVHLVKGLFSDTVEFTMRNVGVIDGMNIDCDLYDATLLVLTKTHTHWRRGTILHFHEYNDAMHKSEEELALDFFRGEHPEVCLTQLAAPVCGFTEPAIFQVC